MTADPNVIAAVAQAWRPGAADTLDELRARIGRPRWHEQAACRGMGELMFDARRTAEAARVCAGCQVAAECGRAGEAEPAGTWAGEWRLSPDVRRQRERRSAARNR